MLCSAEQARSAQVDDGHRPGEAQAAFKGAGEHARVAWQGQGDGAGDGGRRRQALLGHEGEG